jgi:hypothetical protein
LFIFFLSFSSSVCSLISRSDLELAAMGRSAGTSNKMSWFQPLSLEPAFSFGLSVGLFREFPSLFGE